jgi:hypothetical protein
MKPKDLLYDVRKGSVAKIVKQRSGAPDDSRLLADGMM